MKPLVLRWPFEVIDDHFNRPFGRFELQAELFLQDGKDRRTGLDANGVYVFSLALPASAYPAGGSVQGFYSSLLERIAALAGCDYSAPPFSCRIGHRA
jgi:hypothetical protein